MDFNFPNYVTQDFKDKNNSFATIKLTSNVIKNRNVVSYEKNLKRKEKIRRTFSNYKEAYEFAYNLMYELKVDMVVERMSANDRNMFNAVCATNLMPMMEILISDNGQIVPERIATINLLEEGIIMCLISKLLMLAI